MRAVVQRVREARVVVDGVECAAIGAGLCVLVGVARLDGPAEAARLAAKVARLRVFEFERSLLDTDGSALVVSQFTLLADTKRRRGTGSKVSGVRVTLEASRRPKDHHRGRS